MTEQQTLKDATVMSYAEYEIEEYTIDSEPYYLPLSDEVDVFTAAYQEKIPVILKGPTGCGKTRFIEYMAWRLGRPITTMRRDGKGNTHGKALVTIAAHEDLTASDLVGRFLSLTMLK